MVRSTRGHLLGEVLRRTRNGKFIGYSLRWYEGGRRRVMASKQPTAAEARRLLATIEARVARGLGGLIEPPPPAPTVAELVERFLDEYSRPRIKDLARYRKNAQTALRRAVNLIGKRRADELTAIDIGRLREALLRRGAANSARLTLCTLATVFSWAVRDGVLKMSPLKGVELPPRRDAMDYLTSDEVAELLSAAERRAEAGTITDRSLHAAIVFALHTGLRKGELAALRWRDLDLDSGRLTIARSFDGTPKGGKLRHLRLPAAVVPLLRTWQAECPRTTTGDGVVFPRRTRDGQLGMMMRDREPELATLLRDAGLRPLARPWHTLRHTMASHYMMQGGSLLALSKILGHADIKVTMIYAHLSPDFLAHEMDRVKFSPRAK